MSDRLYQYPSYLPPTREPAELLRRQRIQYEVAQQNLIRFNSLSVTNRNSIDIQPERNEQKNGSNKKKRYRNIMIIIIIIVTVIILLFIGIVALYYFFLRRKSSNNLTVPLECTTDPECENGFKCESNICKGGTGKPCIAFINCQSGICTSNTCKGNLNSECTTDNDCAAPFVCINNQCSTDDCVVSTDCGPNQQCNDPIYPFCILDFQQSCTTDTECDTGHPETVGLRCVNRKCLRTGGGLCATGDDCVSSICAAGICRCQKNSDCLNGQLCTAGDCLPVQPVVYG